MKRSNRLAILSALLLCVILLTALFHSRFFLDRVPSSMSPELRALIAKLRSDKVEQQTEACWALALRGADAAPAAPYLIELLDSEKDVNLAAVPTKFRGEYCTTLGEAAAMALSVIGGDALVKLRCVAGAKRAADTARCNAIVGLTAAQDPEATDTFIDALGAKDARVRAAAATALMTLPEQRAVPALTRILNDEDLWVKEAAVMALAATACKASMQSLILALNNGYFPVEEHAANALDQMVQHPRKPTSRAYSDWQQWWDRYSSELQ